MSNIKGKLQPDPDQLTRSDRMAFGREAVLSLGGPVLRLEVDYDSAVVGRVCLEAFVQLLDV
ncbi:hypothetical protein, partial [Streptomyces sp. NPDC057582]|uniref:hypothetical protein n=1 Tax=Streptomyces sp. NPDC057582 TaxID=3346174 RepID=UPI0036CC031F